MTVQKYIDVDLSGTLTAGDIETGTCLETGRSRSPAPGGTTVRCSGITDINGTWCAVPDRA